jgi:hypothetical protein
MANPALADLRRHSSTVLKKNLILSRFQFNLLSSREVCERSPEFFHLPHANEYKGMSIKFVSLSLVNLQTMT